MHCSIIFQFFLELMKVPRVESKLRVFLFKILFYSQVCCGTFMKFLRISWCACLNLCFISGFWFQKKLDHRKFFLWRGTLKMPMIVCWLFLFWITLPFTCIRFDNPSNWRKSWRKFYILEIRWIRELQEVLTFSWKVSCFSVWTVWPCCICW